MGIHTDEMTTEGQCYIQLLEAHFLSWRPGEGVPGVFPELLALPKDVARVLNRARRNPPAKPSSRKRISLIYKEPRKPLPKIDLPALL